MELPSGLMGCAYYAIANGQDEFIHAERVDVVIKDALLTCPYVVVLNFNLGWGLRQSRDPGGALRSEDLVI
jgi:hypothetical protein